jgi:hypothetical protein
MSTRRAAPLVSLREKRSRVTINQDNSDIYHIRTSDVSERFKRLQKALATLARDLTKPEEHAKLLLLLLDDNIILSLHCDADLDWIEPLLDETRQLLIGKTETSNEEIYISSDSTD